MNDNDIFNQINENSDIVDVTYYIVANFNSGLDYKDVRKIASDLIRNYRFSKSDILEGRKNTKINDLIQEVKNRNNSVLRPGEDRQKTQLKTKKKKKRVKEIIIAYMLLFTLGHTIKELTEDIITIIEDSRLEQEVSDYLAMLASTPGSDDYSYKIPLGEQHQETYRNYTTHEVSISYDFHEKALDIINICKKDPNQFDIALSEMYFGLENRLASMEKIFVILKNQVKDDPELLSVHNKIKDCDTFLDYLLKLGLIDSDREVYEIAISKYKEVGTFTSLDVETQEVIEDLIGKYQNHKELWNELNVSSLKELVEEQGESYGSRN